MSNEFWVFLVLVGCVMAALLATFLMERAFGIVYHEYNCLCERCKKAYIKEQWEKLERSRKDTEYLEWRKVVDKHFKEIEQKRFQ